MKCTYRKIEKSIGSPDKKGKGGSPKKDSALKKNKEAGDEDEDSESELAEDSERDEEKVEVTVSEFGPMNPFKDFYRCTPIYNLMSQFG
jgi:hypothetical protein